MNVPMATTHTLRAHYKCTFHVPFTVQMEEHCQWGEKNAAANFISFHPRKFTKCLRRHLNPTWNISTLYLWNVLNLHLMPSALNIDKLPNILNLFFAKPFKSRKIYVFPFCTQLAPFHFKLCFFCSGFRSLFLSLC